YFGVARGTNFEMFEVGLIYIFTQFTFEQPKSKSQSKNYFKIGFLIIIMIFIFYNTIESRGYRFNLELHEHFNMNRNSIINNFIPFLSMLVIVIYDYFGFGFLYIS